MLGFGCAKVKGSEIFKIFKKCIFFILRHSSGFGRYSFFCLYSLHPCLTDPSKVLILLGVSSQVLGGELEAQICLG